jgi:hypothetical protein
LRLIDASSFCQLLLQAKRSIPPHFLHHESRNTGKAVYPLAQHHCIIKEHRGLALNPSAQWPQ